MREYVDGSTAIVRGALDAGCDFFAGYPITPASPILMSMMREMPRMGGVAIQGEDEIASIGMCIGATLAGSKAMTATSGPGISLYSENLGLAIIGEVPLVVVDVQRLGPSTGGATTVSQGDIQFVRWGTGGGYPIIALAPSTVAESYALTARAFALAERFRCPVFLVTDKELATTLTTVDIDSYPGIEIPQRKTVTEGAPYDFSGNAAPLHQYGDGRTVRFTGSTHDEEAYITKDPATVERLNRHLAAKIEDHRNEIEMVDADIQDGAQVLVLGYGITGAAVRSAIAMARAQGKAVSGVVVHSLWPVPETALAAAFQGVTRIVVPELNLGLYRREIERIAPGIEIIGLERIDGELIRPQQIVEMM